MLNRGTHKNKPVVIFLGKLPPPYIGPAVATQIVLGSDLKEDLELVFLNLSDQRDVQTLGKWDMTNIFLALKHYLQLFYLILRYRPGAVYIPAGQTNVGYMRDVGFILIAKLFGKKVITHLRGGNFRNWYNHAPDIIRWTVRKVHPLTHLQIVLSDRLHPLFDWLLPPEKIITVPNGLDIPDPGRKDKKDRPLEVLYLSNYIREKGVLEVLNAAKTLAKEEVHFTLAGGWSEAETRLKVLDFLDKNPGLSVTLHGPLSGEEKEEVLRNADVFVMPTHYINEGLPWALIEAMAWRLPLISTRHAAIPDCIEEGGNGFFVEKRSAEDLAGKIKLFLEEPDLALEMGKRSRELYESRFREKHFIEGLRMAFRQVFRA